MRAEREMAEREERELRELEEAEAEEKEREERERREREEREKVEKEKAEKEKAEKEKAEVDARKKKEGKKRAEVEEEEEEEVDEGQGLPLEKWVVATQQMREERVREIQEGTKKGESSKSGGQRKTEKEEKLVPMAEPCWNCRSWVPPLTCERLV